MQLKDLLSNLQKENQNLQDKSEEDNRVVAEESVSLITFRILGKEFAIDIDQAKEIIKINKVTLVPNSANFVKGVTNLRGEIIPIIDIRERFRHSMGEHYMDIMGFQENTEKNTVSAKTEASEVPPVSETDPEDKLETVDSVEVDFGNNNKTEQEKSEANKKNVLFGKTAIVVNVAQHQYCLLIDAISKTITIPVQKISLNPSLLNKLGSEFIKGIVRRGEHEKDLLMILNLDKIAKE